MTEQEAKKRVKEEKEFYGHLASYLICNVMFIGLSLATGSFWFIFPLLGWGAGLASHAAQVFGLPVKGADWEERRMRELLEQEETQADLAALRDQLRRLERGERRDATELPGVTRLLLRIENLEAIVTSRDWDILDEDYRPVTPPPDVNALPESADDTRRVERLASRVR